MDVLCKTDADVAEKENLEQTAQLELICAGLAVGTSIIDGVPQSKAIDTTIKALKAFNISVDKIPSMIMGCIALQITGNGHPVANADYIDCGESITALRHFLPLAATLNCPLSFMGRGELANYTLQPHPVANADYIDCGESITALRHFLPLAATLNCPLSFMGRGELANYTLQPYYDIFDEQGIQHFACDGALPVTVNGRLQPGTFSFGENVNSQFINGLLFALPLLNDDSTIELAVPLADTDAVNQTITCLAEHGIYVEKVNEKKYLIKGKQHYQPLNRNLVKE